MWQALLYHELALTGGVLTGGDKEKFWKELVEKGL
jgi:hypothetical protein